MALSSAFTYSMQPGLSISAASSLGDSAFRDFLETGYTINEPRLTIPFEELPPSFKTMSIQMTTSGESDSRKGTGTSLSSSSISNTDNAVPSRLSGYSSSVSSNSKTGIATSGIDNAVPSRLIGYSSSVSSNSKTGIATSGIDNAVLSEPIGNPSSLSPNAKLGIAISLPVSAFFLTILGFILLRRRAKERNTARQQEKGGESLGGEAGDTPAFLQRKPELSGADSRYEMPPDDLRFELQGEECRHEIGAGYVTYEVPSEVPTATADADRASQGLRAEDVVHEKG